MGKGRPPKTVEELKLHGNFNVTRHKDRLAAPVATGQPIKPDHLTGEASDLWDFIAAKLVDNGTVKEQDTMALVVACEMWALYRAAVTVSLENPADRDARITVLHYKAAWESSAAKLGLNPADRQKIVSDIPAKQGVKARVRA